MNRFEAARWLRIPMDQVVRSENFLKLVGKKRVLASGGYRIERECVEVAWISIKDAIENNFRGSLGSVVALDSCVYADTYIDPKERHFRDTWFDGHEIDISEQMIDDWDNTPTIIISIGCMDFSLAEIERFARVLKLPPIEHPK